MEISEKELNKFLEEKVKPAVNKIDEMPLQMLIEFKHQIEVILKKVFLSLQSLQDCEKIFKQLPSIAHFLGGLSTITSLYLDPQISELYLQCLGKLYFHEQDTELKKTSSNFVMDLISKMMHNQPKTASGSDINDLFKISSALGFSKEKSMKKLQEFLLSNHIIKDEINDEHISNLCSIIQPLLSTTFADEAVSIFIKYFNKTFTTQNISESFFEFFTNEFKQIKS